MLEEFIEYLKAQVGQPYLWGGQHTKLTPENYITVIDKKETDEEYRLQAEAFCEKKFSEGAEVLYAYDCSGLGCYWLYNLKHLYKGDVNANTMMGRTKLITTAPKRGYWVFKRSGSRAPHIGYMVSDTTLIEAKGRKYGVVETAFREKDWACWGIPLVFESEIVDPPAPPADKVVRVIGGSVNVRKLDSKKGKIIYIAHRGEELPYLGTAPTGWYNVRSKRGDGYITNLAKYTKLEGVNNENE
jgi:hypothetical protein